MLIPCKTFMRKTNAPPRVYCGIAPAQGGIIVDGIEKLDMPVLDEIAKAGGYALRYLGGLKIG